MSICGLYPITQAVPVRFRNVSAGLAVASATWASTRPVIGGKSLPEFGAGTPAGMFYIAKLLITITLSADSGKVKTEPISNVQEENNPDLQRFANERGVVLLAFIGSYVPRRYGPAIFVDSMMSARDEIGVEQALAYITKEYPVKERKLYLLVNSLGGYTSSAFKIAMAVRKSFTDITVFVPHIAASGGTMLALTGNRIRMGMMSQLGPVDVQVLHKEHYISVNSLLAAETIVGRRIAMRSDDELSYLEKQLAESFDPAILAESANTVEMGRRYLNKILTAVGYSDEQRAKMTYKLIFALPTHKFVIQADLAKKIGMRVEPSETNPEEWDMMQRWLLDYIDKAEDRHFVRYVLPKKGKK